MSQFYFTEEAVNDITKIWDYTSEYWSEEQAEIYYRKLIDYCVQIADHPNLGQQYELVHPDLLGLKTKYHIIFYRVTASDRIEITRILHNRMYIESHLK